MERRVPTQPGVEENPDSSMHHTVPNLLRRVVDVRGDTLSKEPSAMPGLNNQNSRLSSFLYWLNYSVTLRLRRTQEGGTHSFNEYSLGACHVQRAGPGPGDRAESRTGGTAASGARGLGAAMDTRQPIVRNMQ